MTTNSLAAGIAVLAAVLFLGGAVFLILNRLRQDRPRRRARSLSYGIRTAEQIDEYHLVRRIHDGQNSRVWEVFDEVSGDHLAMKILNDTNARDKNFQKALRHEWEVTRQLDHPNVICCKRFVQDEETAYIIMELFVSRNLKERLGLIIRSRSGVAAAGMRSRSGQRDFLEKYARSIMQQVGEGLAFLHARGWVHRDVKPANILVAGDAEVRLIDFGLAELVVSRLRRLLPRRRSAQGTVSYMSPEQIRGERLDGRADIYCLGATFYEMVTGRPPLVGQTRTDLLQKHLTEQPRPATAYNAEVSEDFAALLQWMLEKKPEHRPPQVEVVLERLQETPLFRGEAVPNST